MPALRDAIDLHAAAKPDAPFLPAPEPDRSVTYGALRDTARALCPDLAARGIRAGDVVSYMLPNGISAAGVGAATALRVAPEAPGGGMMGLSMTPRAFARFQ